MDNTLLPLAVMACPYCQRPSCEADWTETRGGWVQVEPFVCPDCGAQEFGPFDTTSPTADERRTGWYAPNSLNKPVRSSSWLNGKEIDPETALMLYLSGLVDRVPFVVTAAPAALASLA